MNKNDNIDQINMLKYFRLVRFSKGLNCPHCENYNVIKNGKYNGKQRYKCKSCRKTFNDFTNTPFNMTHFVDKWPIFMKCMINGTSLRESQKIVGVTYVTLFYWRHKILSALKMNNISEFKGIVETDDFVLAYSEKGKKNIEGRPSKKRGTSRYEEIEDKIYSLVASDRYRNITSLAISRNNFAAFHIENAIGTLMKKTNILCSNYKSAYVVFSKRKKITHYRIGNFIKEEMYNVDIVKSHIRNFKGWIEKFNGVATKYLNNYLCWYKFINSINFDFSIVGIKRMIEVISLNDIRETNESLRTCTSWV